MPITLTEAMIRSVASKEIFSRGQEYYHGSAIYDAAISGDVLTAKCRGNHAPHYNLRVELDDAGIRDATCTCAYDYGGYCKHIVALLLTYLRTPDTFEQRIAPQDLLRELDRDQMAALLTALMQSDPKVRDAVEHWLTQLSLHRDSAQAANTTGKALPATAVDTATVDTAAVNTAAVNTAPYRRRIRALIREANEYFNSDSDHEGECEDLAQGLDEIIQSITGFIEAGQPADALAIATASLDEIEKSRDSVDYDLNEVDDFTLALDLLMAEGVLSMDLNAGKRQKLLDTLSDNGSRFPTAIQALQHGWNATVRNGDGEAGREDGNSEEDADADVGEGEYDEADELTSLGVGRSWPLQRPQPDVVDAQLNVLGRRSDHERYLSIALAAGRHMRYAHKLVELDRAPEAVKHAARHFKQANEALVLAQKLRERNQVEEAVAVAARGLRLARPRASLGGWLAPIAEARGDKGLAQRAWTAVFGEQPSLELYQHIKELAGQRWSAVKPVLLKLAAGSWRDDVYAQILLDEQDWDAAIALANKHDRALFSTTQDIVADGVAEHRPAWVVELGKQRAEALIATVSSASYPQAAKWLARVKNAYIALDQRTIWNAYLAQLKGTYRRRPSLQKALKTLG